MDKYSKSLLVDNAVLSLMPKELRYRKEGCKFLKILILTASLISVSIITGCTNNNNNPNTTKPEPPLRAIPGADQTILVGQTVTFDGRNSTGNIVEYIWDFDKSDGINVGDAKGPVVSHKYDRCGEYRVTLTVVNSKGEKASSYCYVFVNYFQEHSSMLTMGSNATYSFPVLDGIASIYVKLQYPSGAANQNRLNLNIFAANDSEFYNSASDQRESGDTQTVEVKCSDFRMLVPHGDWKAQISCIAGINVNYNITIEAKY